MEEKKQSKRGGKRIGAGRPPKSDSKKQIAIKLDRDLDDIFKSSPFSKDASGLNRGRYINEAIREKMERDSFIKSNSQHSEAVVAIPCQTKE
jgi:uncharacterized protein (DUF4415 family)